MFLLDLIARIKFWKSTDRIGPDIPWTHWRLYFPKKMKKLCQRKFHSFGENAEVRPGSYVVGCSQVSLGSKVIIRPGTMIHAESETLEHTVQIDNDVLIGSGVHIYVENHHFSNPDISIIYQGHSQAEKVTIGEGSWIGANAIILPGVTIGKNCVIELY